MIESSTLARVARDQTREGRFVREGDTDERRVLRPPCLRHQTVLPQAHSKMSVGQWFEPPKIRTHAQIHTHRDTHVLCTNNFEVEDDSLPVDLRFRWRERRRKARLFQHVETVKLDKLWDVWK